MVDKNCGGSVPLCGQFALELTNKSWLRGFHLVHRHYLNWLSGRKNLPACVAFRTPWHFGHSTKKAACASWRGRPCQFAWCLPLFCQFLQLFKGQVTESTVPAHKLGLIAVGLGGIFDGLGFIH